MNPLRRKTLGRPVRACPLPECRVTLYLGGTDERCPGCGEVGTVANELAHAGVGARR